MPPTSEQNAIRFANFIDNYVQPFCTRLQGEFFSDEGAILTPLRSSSWRLSSMMARSIWLFGNIRKLACKNLRIAKAGRDSR